MAVICPTVMAKDSHDYREQMERVEAFATRVHIDLVDGHFAPNKTLDPGRIWWPDGACADIHLMYRRPLEKLSLLIKLRPHLVIIHAEADVDHVNFASGLRRVGIRAGLAITRDTTIRQIDPILHNFDHLLIFGGHLSYHSKEADLSMIDRIHEIRKKHPRIEVGWDGGINDRNIKEIAGAGVNVLNVGGFIQSAPMPFDAYSALQKELN
jgi:ribulose-phosphate 3-epimerase